MNSAGPKPRVVADSSGELFLLGGSNQAAELFSPAGYQRLVPIPRWRALMARRAAFFDQHGIPWRLVIAPEKLSVYGTDLLPGLVDGPATAPGESFIEHIGADHADHIVYPRVQLREAARQMRVYPRTDSHWSSAGAFVAFQAAMRSAGIAFDAAGAFRAYARRMTSTWKRMAPKWSANGMRPMAAARRLTLRQLRHTTPWYGRA